MEVNFNGVSMKLKPIPKGCFINEDLGKVLTLKHDYWLGETEVTQAQYEAVMGKNPSYFNNGKEWDYPVECVAWEDAMIFCKRLTELEKAAGRLPSGYEYSLPTEAQWEHACRAGTTTEWYFGNSLSSDQANFDGNQPVAEAPKGGSIGRTTLVRSYKPNAWGLYDLHGNVWEWCRDCGGNNDWNYDPETLVGMKNDSHSHQMRGGSWNSGAWWCRSSARCECSVFYKQVIECAIGTKYHSKYSSYGFRIALVPVYI